MNVLHRKRRLETLISEQQPINESSSLKKLSNGKFACLVCPHNPVLDSLLIFSTHCKGSRHVAAESRLKLNKASERATFSSPTVVRDNAQAKRKCRDEEKSHGNKDPCVSFLGVKTSCEVVSREDLDRRERELNFTAAGWKRDCHGGWYKDENVEFDSDEDDPNVCLR